MTKRFGDRSSVMSARVLVVEDENIIAKDIAYTLKGLGYTVCGVVDTGDDAVRTALEETPDLILMDVRIRGPVDGIQAAERIRGQLSVPIVFLTAFADEATLERARGAAPYGYVLKPFEDRDLQVAILMALTKHEAFQELDVQVRARTDELLKSEARFRQMSAVADLGIFALCNHELDAVLERAVRVTCETLGTDCASVLELTPDDAAFCIRAKCGWPATYGDNTTLPAGTGSQAGYTLARSEPVICDDYSTEKRFRIPEEVARAGIRSAITVVIHSREHSRPYGILGTYTRSKRTFTVSESAFLQALANVIANTVARVGADEQRVKAERATEEQRLHAARAEEAVRLRDDFLSIASHELKTPLTSLHLQLQSLAEQEGALDERISRKLDRATRSSERLGALIESLLDVAGLSTGGLALNRELVTLHELVEDIIDRFAEEARRARCELRLVNRTGAMAGWWDRVRLEQVLTNLLTNACKFGANRPIEIELGRAGADAEIRVKDQGPGIEPADVERIFRRFERAVSLRHFGGLGLGLYIARQIVESHGGTVQVESEPGRGSTFMVTLPIERGHETATRKGTIH